MDKDDQVERLVKQIRLCPPWTRISASDQLAKQNVLKCLDAIANNDTSLIRKAVEQFRQEQRTPRYPIDELSRLFLLNRYLFKIPSKSNMADAQFFGGWGRVRMMKRKLIYYGRLLSIRMASWGWSANSAVTMAICFKRSTVRLLQPTVRAS